VAGSIGEAAYQLAVAKVQSLKLPAIAESAAAEPSSDDARVAEREQYAHMLRNQVNAGLLGADEPIRRLGEYDAANATKRMAKYSLLSTIVAAISAIASATAAYLAYAALHVVH
jgi:hypothetical protein